MSKPNPSPLKLLIGALTKAEKRHFKLYGDKDMKFLTLFDLLDKSTEPSKKALESKLEGTKGSALSNLKSHLYEQLLISLRLLHHHDRSIRIDELVSFAKVLYIKGLYMQSLDQLKKAKVIASNYQNDLALYRILEMERKIELFFVTESGYERAKDIVDANIVIRNSLHSQDQWSNLALMLYDYYLKFGHVKNQRQFRKVAIYFKNEISLIEDNKVSTHALVYRHMAYTWFHFITQSFAICYKHACAWVQEMSDHPHLLEDEPIMYLKGLHNMLSALFYSNKPRQFDESYQILIDFLDKNEANFDANTTITADTYRYIGGLNQRFLQGEFRKNEGLVDEITAWLKENDHYLDQNRIQVFYYKIACLYFGAEDFKNTIRFLNKIIHTDSKENHLRQDVQCFARILNLVAHYELGNNDLVEYQLKSTYRFLIKYGDLQKVQRLIIDFIRKSVHMNQFEMTAPFAELKRELLIIFDDPFERRPLLYLDLISWLSSRLDNIHVEDVIRKRQIERRGKAADSSRKK
jgi:hypothetical protein